MLTPKDIQNIEFSNAMRGYNRKEVDEFLDQLTIDYQSVLEENRGFKGEIAKLQQEIEDQKKSENSVMNTLEQAKRLMSDISESAEKRAEVIIKNARLDALTITRNAKDAVASYTDEAEQLQRRITKFREKFRSLLSEELERVDHSVDDLFDGLETEVQHQRQQTENLDKNVAELGLTQEPEQEEQTLAEKPDDLDKTRVIDLGSSHQEADSDSDNEKTVIVDRAEIAEALHREQEKQEEQEEPASPAPWASDDPKPQE